MTPPACLPRRRRLGLLFRALGWAALPALAQAAAEPDGPPLDEQLKSSHPAPAEEMRALRPDDKTRLEARALDEAAPRRARLRAISLLGAQPDEGAFTTWSEARTSADPEVRLQAAFAEGLARCRADVERPCEAWLRALLDEDDARLREVAVDLLWRRRSSAAREALAERSADEGDEAVRRRIERRLAAWGS